MRHDNGQAGFTILETLVAFAILAVALIALYAALGDSAQRVRRSQTAVQGSMIAASQLDLLRARRAVPDWNVERPIPNSPFSISFVPRQDDSSGTTLGSMTLVPVTAIVRWTEAGARRSLSVDAKYLARVRLGGG